MNDVENKMEVASKNVIEASGEERVMFKQGIAKLSALALLENGSDDIHAAKRECEIGLAALNAENGLQEMLIVQMLSVHHLQQQSMYLAKQSENIQNIKYFTNTAIKLANCFVQQASMLSRLQGGGNQKITVEHVDVHAGGQAIVGNVMPSTKGVK